MTERSYISVASVFGLSREQSAAYVWRKGCTVDLDATSAACLRLCSASRTLAQHAQVITRALGTRCSIDVRAVLARLVTLDLLEPIGLAEGTRCLSRTKIATVGIITADRPTALARCLQSVVAEMRRHGHLARIVVVDGSRSRANRRRSRWTVSQAAAQSGFDIDHVSHRESAAIRRCVGDSPWLLQGLVPGEIGANRNLLMLLTAGEPILTIDDDVVCEGWATGESEGRALLTAYEDGREWRFFGSRKEALAVPGPLSVDVIAAHEDVLGQTVPDLVDALAPEVDSISASVAKAMAQERSMRVRLTFSGLAGDTGGYCPYFDTLFATGLVRSRLRIDSSQLAVALSSREVRRVANRLVIRHRASCMAYCMGIANDTPLPPFIGIGRNEDGVFGVMTSAVEPHAHYADLAHGVLHDSHRASSYGFDAPPSVMATRLCDVVFAAVAVAEAGSISLDRGARFASIARVMSEVAELDDQPFSEWFARAVLATRSRMLLHLEATETGAAAGWKRAVRHYRETLAKSIKRPEFFIPIEFRSYGDSASAISALRRWLRNYAVLIHHWPALWEAARDGDLLHIRSRAEIRSGLKS